MLFFVEQRSASLRYGHVAIMERSRDLVGKEIKNGPPAHLGRFARPQPAEVRHIRKEVTTLDVFEEDEVGKIVDDGPEEIALRLELFLHLLHLGNFTRNTAGADNPSLSVMERQLGRQ